MSELRQLTSGEFYKFETAGDFIEGKLLKVEQSKQYKDSWSVSLETKEGVKTAYVSNIVIDLFEKNSVTTGKVVRIMFNGLKKTKDGSRKYKDYSVFA